MQREKDAKSPSEKEKVKEKGKTLPKERVKKAKTKVWKATVRMNDMVTS